MKRQEVERAHVMNEVNLRDTMKAIQESKLREALRLNGYTVNGAAQSLGIHRATVYRLMRKYGIEIRRIVA